MYSQTAAMAVDLVHRSNPIIAASLGSTLNFNGLWYKEKFKETIDSEVLIFLIIIPPSYLSLFLHWIGSGVLTRIGLNSTTTLEKKSENYCFCVTNVEALCLSCYRRCPCIFRFHRYYYGYGGYNCYYPNGSSIYIPEFPSLIGSGCY